MIYEVSRDGDTSSECSECKKENHEHEHEEESSEDQLAQPIVQPLSHHSHHSSQLVRLLQEENKRLKLITEDQEREVKQLRIQLEMSRIRPFMSSQLGRSAKQLPKFKLQGQITPKGINRVQSPDFKHHPNAGGQPYLKVVLLQKQIKQLQLKLFQLTSKLREYEQREGWMNKFIVSFVNMAEELSVNYGSKLQIKGLNLRKKTKMCWKYIKELINYLIK